MSVLMIPNSLPSSTSRTNNHANTIKIDAGKCHDDPGYTIVVPANVRFRGMNMQLDLQIDQRTLAAASELTKAVEEVVSSVSSVTSPERSKRGVVRIPSSDTPLSFSIADPERRYGKSAHIVEDQPSTSSTSPVMDGTVGESSTEDASAGNVSSTTGHEVREELPSTSSQYVSTTSEDVDTTVSTSENHADEVASSTSQTEEPSAPTSTSEVPTSTGDPFPASISRPPSACMPSSTANIQDENPSHSLLPASTPSESQSVAADSEMDESQPSCSSAAAGQEPAAKKNAKKKLQAQSTNCEYTDEVKGQQCKQRAICNYRFCIRHILFDPDAPYKQCQHQRKPKSKKDEALRCTNAIKKENPEMYCSTHLIMRGEMAPKKKKEKPGNDPTAKDATASVASDLSTSNDIFGDLPVDHGSFAMGPESCNTSMSFESSLHSSPYDANSAYPMVSNNVHHAWDVNGGGPMEAQSHSPYYGHPTMPHPTSSTAPQRTPSYRPHFDQERFLPPGYPDHHAASPSPCSMPPSSSPFCPSMPASSTGTVSGSVSQGNFAVGVATNTSKPLQIPRSHMSSVSCMNPSQLHESGPPTPQGLPPDGLHAPPPMSSKLSKQHPQLAAKLMQQTPPPYSVAVAGMTSSNAASSRHASPLPTAVATSTPNSSPVKQQQAPQYDPRLQPPRPAQIIVQSHGPVPKSNVAPSSGTLIRTNYMPLTAGSAVPPQPASAALAQHHAAAVASHPVEVIVPASASSLTMVHADPAPVRYDVDRLANDSVDEEEKFQRDYLGDSSVQRKKQRIIKLRQKRRKINIKGSFRKVPLVDAMCKVVENFDLDTTDLFPLGLEPSDDESSSDDGFEWQPSEHAGSNRVELYLLKKQLRLESARLVQRAKLTVPIIQAAKPFKNCAGAALRARQCNRRRESLTGVEHTNTRRCAHITAVDEPTGRNGELVRRSMCCGNLCLPMSNHCMEHVLYNVNQKLFSYCSRSCCGRPVAPGDAASFNGLCRAHFAEKPTDKHSAGTPSAYQTTVPNGVDLATSLPSMFHEPAAHKRRKVEHHPSYYVPPVHDPSHREHDTDGMIVEGDVSLASVAKDLGIEGRDLTDMLARLPVDDALDANEVDDSDGFLSVFSTGEMKAEEEVPGMDLGHSWADVEQFLLSEGYNVESPVNASEMSSTPAGMCTENGQEAHSTSSVV